MSEDVSLSYDYLCRRVSQLSAQVAERNATISAQEQRIAELRLKLGTAEHKLHVIGELTGDIHDRIRAIDNQVFGMISADNAAESE